MYYPIGKNGKSLLMAVAIILLLLTLLSIIFILGEPRGSAWEKIMIMYFFAILFGIPGFSAAKHLNRYEPTYYLGLIGVICSAGGFTVYVLVMLSKIDSIGFIRFATIIWLTACFIGFMCGLLTYKNDHQVVRAFRVVACSGLILLYFFIVYSILKTKNGLMTEPESFLRLFRGTGLGMGEGGGKLLSIVGILTLTSFLATKIFDRYFTEVENETHFSFEEEAPELPTVSTNTDL
jgi:uncharacterized membrane protein